MVGNHTRLLRMTTLPPVVIMPVDTGSPSTGFVIWGAALVFFMTPVSAPVFLQCIWFFTGILQQGLALFYSGLSKFSSALSLMLLCMMSLAVVSIQFFLFGFSLAFSESGSPFIGDFNMGALNTLGTHAFPHTAPQIPTVAFMLFQMQFAGIAAALVFGSVPERTRILPGMIFVFFWTTLVYDFIAYWTWADHGFLRNFSCLGEPDFLEKPCFIGVYDFAGGGPIHVTAGFSGLAYVFVLGKRKVIHAEHHNLVNMMFGTGVLWFGWFGFNAAAAGAANTRAAMAGVVTTISASSGGLTWVWFDFIFTRKLSSFSFCSGVIAGLLGITPASGFVAPWAAIVIGSLVSLGCYTSCRLKKRWGIDDSFDAGSLHGVGGFLGMVLTGVFAQKWITDLDDTPSRGGVIEGNWIQVVYQTGASALIAAWAFSVSYAILFVINKIPGLHLRQSEADEALGGDLAEMGEIGYRLAPAELSTPQLNSDFRRQSHHHNDHHVNTVQPSNAGHSAWE